MCLSIFIQLPRRGALLRQPGGGVRRLPARRGFLNVAGGPSALRRRHLLQSYFQMTYYRGILERYDVRAKEAQESLMRHAEDQAGDPFSISAFTATLKTRGIVASKRTTANSPGYLKEEETAHS